MKTEKVICDHCNKDLTYTSNYIDYRLVLSVENKPKHSGLKFVTAMYIHPDIENTMHFCGIKCLISLINNNYGDVIGTGND